MNVARITPFLWFDGRALEAARFYTSVFPNSKIEDEREGATSLTFWLDGTRFIALDGGPSYAFSKAVSFFVSCDSQAEVDHFWQRLSEGGETSRCGWLDDTFGLTWQVVPRVLGELLSSDDDGASERVMNAMLAMTKLDIAALERAAREPSV